MKKDLIIVEIENAHKLANKYLQKKDMTEYLNTFADELEYKQLNGKIIDKAQLTKDTQKYFERIEKIENKSEQLNCEIENDIFIEKILQKSTVEIRVFIFFKKKWNLSRLGIYKWKKINGIWKIIRVEILQESII